MRHRLSIRLRFSIGAVLIVIAGLVCLGPAAFADKKSEAREQFERAVKMRTMLEGYLPRDRALDDYRQTIAAYQKVYLISARAEEVTPSLIAEAELYREMGRLFDPKYFQTAVNTYEFLLTQYPETHYRGEAMFAIAEIQKEDQQNLGAAEATFRDFLKRYPKSERAEDAREALEEMADARENPGSHPSGAQGRGPSGASEGKAATEAAKNTGGGAGGPPVVNSGPKTEWAQLGPILAPRESDKHWAAVKSINAANDNDRTRIVVALDDTVKYEEARLQAPDRIYFDLHKARVAPKISGKSIDFQSGLLKSVRVGQNRPGVVRVVLDANGAKECTAVLVGNPYRLVIDLRADPRRAAQASALATANPDSDSKTAAALDEGTARAADTEKPRDTLAGDTGKPAVQPDAASAPVANVEKTAGGAKSTYGLMVTRKPPSEPKPTRDGQRSLTRTLGLKIGRIVIDPGHGGHDTGTIGPHGLMEKDLCLDVALRLGRIIEEKLPGAEVIYTRKDDTFIPLEQRTALANEAKADLFISIHANSSRDHDARGVETYYLNFATTPESMEVATRENAYSEKSLHDLEDLVQKIARNEKIEESKELASDIQDALSHRLQLVSASEHNRGVKRAPFVVLIGANMPSVLTEISFVSNPADERMLKKPDQRERIANGLYRGIATYLESLNSLSYNKQKLAETRPGGSDAPSSQAMPSPGVRPEQ
jgi:N-acetylmuramoyl-L-alanine amidase